MGVYPLLEDETCWFLAVDFDKSTWTEDVSAFVETCRRVGLPAAVERSRSGNGAHVWFFFSAPVPASIARKMGCYLITETMSRRHQLSMESYDRLFPSQDTMPRGGFGNLIALPLQHEAAEGREHGLPRRRARSRTPMTSSGPISPRCRASIPAAVEAIAREATRQGSVVGVRLAEHGGRGRRRAVGAPPFAKARSRRSSPEPLPPKVRAVLAQRLFVEKAGLPSPLINQIKRLAAFQNPEFYKKQSMRLSTAMTPRVIACAEDLPQHVGLPRGCQTDLEALLREYGMSLDVADERVTGEPLRFRFHGKLTPVQRKAATALLAHDIGVFVAPPGVGKTVVGTYLVAARGCSTLILVHRRPLLDQWLAQLSLFLGIEPKEIGQIGAGKKTGNGRLDVAMIQSLVRKEKVEDLVASYGQVIVDECHHLPAVSFERVLSEVKARYVVGLTATPQRRDGHHPITEMQLGPVRFAVDPKSQAARRPFAHKLIVRETDFKTSGEETPSIQELYAALAADERRNRLILDDVIQALEEGRSPILLTERKDHLEYFADATGEVRAPPRRAPGRHGRQGAARGEGAARRDSGSRGAARSRDRPVHRRGLRRRTTRHALSGAAGVVEGDAGPVHRPPPPAPSRQDGGPNLRLRRPRRADAAADVREAAARVPGDRLRARRGAARLRGAGDEVVVEYDEDVLRSLKELDDFA